MTETQTDLVVAVFGVGVAALILTRAIQTDDSLLACLGLVVAYFSAVELAHRVQDWWHFR